VAPGGNGSFAPDGNGVTFPHFPGLDKNRTSAERDLFIATMQAFKLDPANVAACIEFETGGAWRTDIQNETTKAVGLIGFMPSTAKNLGTTVDNLRAQTFEQQLGYVVRYFQAIGISKLKRPVDYYAAVFWPAAIGTDDSYVIAKLGSPAYAANKGLDRHGNGQITTADLRETIEGTLARATGTNPPKVKGGQSMNNSGHYSDEQSVAPVIVGTLALALAIGIFVSVVGQRKALTLKA